MRVLFLVQGEGNGHLTQAISLSQMLTRQGHEVVAVLVGGSSRKKIPAFFTEAIRCPVYSYKSPGLHYSGDGRLNEALSLFRLLRGLPVFAGSLRYIHRMVQSLGPDLIVNFYEIAGGAYNFFYGARVPMACIAHQYLFLHPGFRFPPDPFRRRSGLNFWSRCTSHGAAGIFALSFHDSLPDTGRIRVVPPLLREEVRALTPTAGEHILIYITQPRLSREVMEWHLANPSVMLHCFLNSPDQPANLVFDPTLVFHAVHPRKFLELLQSCRALVTTAGFESVCEAMYLRKPVMMIPVPNHFEQSCNAADGARHGLGVAHHQFDLSVLLDYLPGHRPPSSEAWVLSAERSLLKQLEALVPVKRHAAPQPV